MALAGYLLILLGIAMIWIVLRDARRGTTDLLSIRTVLFVSFGVFQISSAAIPIFFKEYADYPLQHPARTAWIYAISAIFFIGLFQLTYASGIGVKRLAWRTPGVDRSPNTFSLLVLSLLILGIGILFKKVFIYIPVFGPLSDLIGGAQLAVAVGLATWAWAPRLLNPVIAAWAGSIILVALIVSVLGTYGRRDLVSVMAAAGWAMYHGWWKHGGFSFAIKRLAVVGLAGAVLLAAWSSVRGARAQTTADVVRSLASSRTSAVRSGLYDMASGQLAGNISLWVIETHPDPFPYKTLHSIWYGSTLIVPRQFYPDKPVALGIQIPKQARLRGRGEGFSVGAGLIGHMYNDNPWIALWLYPVVLGLAVRYLDEAMISRPHSPFIILPVGAALGEVLGLARGELALFAFNVVISTIAAYVMMLFALQVLTWFGWRPQYDEDSWDDDAYEHDPWTYDESYGEEEPDAA